MSDSSILTRLTRELDAEATATRRLLERLPEDRLSWRPHERSLSLGQLAMHVAGVPWGIARLLEALRTEVPDVQYPEARSRRDALQLLTESVEQADRRLQEWGDEGLEATWRMTSGDTVLVECPRYEIVRSLMLNHWYHHRGQLTVYLRMLDVPLPATYGPTADES